MWHDHKHTDTHACMHTLATILAAWRSVLSGSSAIMECIYICVEHTSLDEVWCSGAITV